MTQPDPRRRVPPTDRVLADPRLVEAGNRLGPAVVKDVVRAAQQRVRNGELPAEAVADAASAGLPARATTSTPVLNATGVVVHTNLGRAPLSDVAVDALAVAAGYTDVELDLGTGRRGRRGAAAIAALLEAVPAAGAAHVVNNGAAALLLAVTALAAGREVIVARGELVEIGDGFRLPDLMTSSGARLHEVGTTNRTTIADYADAVGPETGCVVRIHPSNFRIEGFTSSPGVAQLATLGVPIVADIGSGLLAPELALPDEPDAASALRAGANLVTASGDKLLGGPQAGLLLGDADILSRLTRHPMARALRVDKLTLAALEATLRGPVPPVTAARTADPEQLHRRAVALADRVGGRVRRHDGVVGGGGAPGVLLPGYAVALPSQLAEPLRSGDPAVLGRVEHGLLLLDLRCIPPAADAVLADTVQAALSMLPGTDG